MATEEQLDEEELEQREEAREFAHQWVERRMKLAHDYPLHAYIGVPRGDAWMFVHYIYGNPTRYPVLHRMVQDDIDSDGEVYTRVTIDDFVRASFDDSVVDDFPWEELEAAATRYTTLLNCTATEAKYRHDQALTEADRRYMDTGERPTRKN